MKTLAVAAAAVAAAATVAHAQFNVLEHLASKGPYFPKQNFSDHTPPPAQCVPIHLNLVARHGSRASGEDDLIVFERIAGLIDQYSASIRSPYRRPIATINTSAVRLATAVASTAPISPFSVAPTDTTGKVYVPPGKPPSGAIART